MWNTPTASLQTGNPPNEYPVYDIKQTDGDAPAFEIWEMRSIPSLSLLPGPLWPGVVALDWVLFIGQIEQFDI